LPPSVVKSSWLAADGPADRFAVDFLFIPRT